MSANANSTNPPLVNQQQHIEGIFDKILGTNALPAPVQEQKLLTVAQVDKRLRDLERQAPGFSFKNKDVVRNRYNRTSVSRAT